MDGVHLEAMDHRQNPFPGMNPFIVQRWRDAHASLVSYIRDALGSELPEAYFAQIEERVRVAGGGGSPHYAPDVSVIDDRWKQGVPPLWAPQAKSDLLDAAANPVIIHVDTPPERWVEIHHEDGDLVTVIEVVIPSNREADRAEYVAKRSDFLSAGVSVVEIDLLRAGRRVVDLDPVEYQRRFGELGEHHTISTTRSIFPNRREIYACPLRQKLPVIRIPLRFDDSDVPLDLQALVDRGCTAGRYWRLDYNSPLNPPFNPPDQTWIEERLSAAGLK